MKIMRRPANTKKALLFSALVHVVVFLILIASFEFSGPLYVTSNTDLKVVDAVVIEDSKILAPPTKPVEVASVKPEELPVPVQPKSEPELQKSAKTPTASKSPVDEKKLALSDVHKKETIEKEKPKLTDKQDISKKLLADLEDEIAKQAKQKNKKIKNKFNKELKAQSERSIEKLLNEEAPKPGAGERAQNNKGIVDKYKGLILQAISQEWVVPTHVNRKLYCELLIKLSPGGVVVDVQITKSSGDILLDRSARAAVFKASPLPVPSDIYSFEPFREFVLKVKPEYVVDNGGANSFWIS